MFLILGQNLEEEIDIFAFVILLLISLQQSLPLRKIYLRIGVFGIFTLVK